jgi:hypothetical protein
VDLGAQVGRHRPGQCGGGGGLAGGIRAVVVAHHQPLGQCPQLALAVAGGPKACQRIIDQRGGLGEAAMQPAQLAAVQQRGPRLGAQCSGVERIERGQ